jgi:hypothetical protein
MADNGVQQSTASAGSNSMRHTWLGYVSVIVPLFIWTWTLLGFVGITFTISKSWDLLCIGSIWAFLGIVICIGRYFQQDKIISDNADDGVEWSSKRSSMINDHEYFKFLTAAGLFFFCVTLTVWLTYNANEGDAKYSVGFYATNATNITLFLSEGLDTRIAVSNTHVLGMILSFLCIAWFIMTHTGSDISRALERDGIKNPLNWAAAKTMTNWGNKKPGVA